MGGGPKGQREPLSNPACLQGHEEATLLLRKYHHLWNNSEEVFKKQHIRQKLPLDSRDILVLSTQVQTSGDQTAAILSSSFTLGVSWVAAAFRMSTNARVYFHTGSGVGGEFQKSFHQPDLKSTWCSWYQPAPSQSRPGLPVMLSIKPDHSRTVTVKLLTMIQRKKEKCMSHVTQYTHAHIFFKKSFTIMPFSFLFHSVPIFKYWFWTHEIDFRTNQLRHYTLHLKSKALEQHCLIEI